MTTTTTSTGRPNRSVLLVGGLLVFILAVFWSERHNLQLRSCFLLPPSATTTTTRKEALSAASPSFPTNTPGDGLASSSPLSRRISRLSQHVVPNVTTIAGHRVLFQYTHGDWPFNRSWALAAEYCAYANCRHLIVQGDCGFNPKICKRLTHLAVARITRNQTLFWDNDVVWRNPQLNDALWDDLCPRRLPLSMACQFPGHGGPQDRTNTCLMCMDVEWFANDPAGHPWLSILDVVSRCSNASRKDQYAFYRTHMRLYGNELVYCYNYHRYGQRTSRGLAHYWGTQHTGLEEALDNVEWDTAQRRAQLRSNGEKVPNIARQSILWKLEPGTFRVVEESMVDWNDRLETSSVQRRLVNYSLLYDGWPHDWEIQLHAPFFMPKAVAPQCEFALANITDPGVFHHGKMYD